MAEFERVRGQIEGLWNEGMTEAAARARRSGEAAGEERVLQAVAKLETEWPERHGHPVPGFGQELRRRLSLPESPWLSDISTAAEARRELGIADVGEPDGPDAIAQAQAEEVADAAVADHKRELEQQAALAARERSTL